MRILRLWSMIVHYHGRVINYANMAQFMDISVLKIKNYLMFLEGTFMIRILHPWYDDLEKRLVKTPKLYIRDAGIYHSLLSIRSYDDLLSNTHIGQSWEGFALEEVTKILSIRSEECYFWSTHQQAELDLFINLNGKRIGFEFKTSDRPSVTKSMRSAMGYLKLDQLFIVTPVEETFLLEEKVTVLALKDCLKTLQSVPKNTNNRLTPHIRVLQ